MVSHQKEVTRRFAAGDKVMVGDTEGVVADIGMNINKLPVCKVGGRWYLERELEEWYPPCPI